VVYFGGFFAKLGYFAGFSLYIINFPESISEAAMGSREGTGTLYIIHNLGAQWKDTELPEFLCCPMICNHPPPPTQVSVGELYIQGIERQRGGSHFPRERQWGDPNHTTAQRLHVVI
jgi:hypothetical protein